MATFKGRLAAAFGLDDMLGDGLVNVGLGVGVVLGVAPVLGILIFGRLMAEGLAPVVLVDGTFVDARGLFAIGLSGNFVVHGMLRTPLLDSWTNIGAAVGIRFSPPVCPVSAIEDEVLRTRACRVRLCRVSLVARTCSLRVWKSFPVSVAPRIRRISSLRSSMVSVLTVKVSESTILAWAV